MYIRIKPPKVPIIKFAVLEPIIQFKPAKMSNIKIISAIICPKLTKGPAIYPFLIVSVMVMVNIGPGTNAPESPTKNDVSVKRKISIK